MPTPPVAARRPHTITQLGRTRTDDYFWMKDENWQQVMRDPSVLRADIREDMVVAQLIEAQLGPWRGESEPAPEKES